MACISWKRKSIHSKIIQKRNAALQWFLNKDFALIWSEIWMFCFVSFLLSRHYFPCFLSFNWHFVWGSYLDTINFESLFHHFLSSLWRCSESAYILLLILFLRCMSLCDIWLYNLLTLAVRQTDVSMVGVCSAHI